MSGRWTAHSSQVGCAGCACWQHTYVSVQCCAVYLFDLCCCTSCRVSSSYAASL